MAKAKSASRIEDILVKSGVVDDLQLRSAHARMSSWGGRVAHVLVDMGFATEDAVATAISKALKMPITHLGTVVKDPAALTRLDVKYCEENAVFPVVLKDRLLQLAMADPTELNIIDDVQAKFGVRVQALLASELEIKGAIARHYRGQEFKPAGRGVRRFTGEELPSVKEEQNFELDPSVPPIPEPYTGPGPQSMGDRPPSANSLLDEMLESRGEDGFTPEELARLDAARINQQKTGTILKALTELLTQKGLLR